MDSGFKVKPPFCSFSTTRGDIVTTSKYFESCGQYRVVVESGDGRWEAGPFESLEDACCTVDRMRQEVVLPPLKEEQVLKILGPVQDNHGDGMWIIVGFQGKVCQPYSTVRYATFEEAAEACALLRAST